MLQTVTVLLRVQAALTLQLTLFPSCPAVVSAAAGDVALAAVAASASSFASVCMKFLLDMVESCSCLAEYNPCIYTS